MIYNRYVRFVGESYLVYGILLQLAFVNVKWSKCWREKGGWLTSDQKKTKKKKHSPYNLDIKHIFSSHYFTAVIFWISKYSVNKCSLFKTPNAYLWKDKKMLSSTSLSFQPLLCFSPLHLRHLHPRRNCLYHLQNQRYKCQYKDRNTRFERIKLKSISRVPE